MALIEVFHVVASDLDIDATNTTNIPQGSLVTMGSDGNVTMETAGASGAAPYAIGIAGDSRSTGTTSYTAESGSALGGPDTDPTSTLTGSLVLGALGAAQRFTQNRVADNYNEVLASGKMTVYHGGGEFWTDQYDTSDDLVPGDLLYMSAATAGHFTRTADNTDPGHLVALCLTGPTQYPSGVPGTQTGFTQLPEGGNSMTFGSFLHVQLRI